METTVNNNNNKYISMFKSYYVVWKLSSPESQCRTQLLFKSYYVVWKLLRKTRTLKFIHMFKSYYVVWKLKKVAYAPSTPDSLNRTM